MTRRSLLVALAVCLLGTSFAGPVPKEDDPKKDQEKLQGSWEATAVEVEGKATPLPEGGVHFAFDKDKATVTRGKRSEDMTYKIDAAKKPKTLDLVVRMPGGKNEETTAAIYELDRDTLKIAFTREGPKDKRPAGFDGKGLTVITLKRKKP